MGELVTQKSQELQHLETQLSHLSEDFAQVLPAEVPPDRIIRTVVVSVQNNPKLLECDRGSVLQSAMSAAVLGLEVDGVTGQGYLIPFKGRAQFIVGYKGFETMAARAGYTINSGVVREGDDFDYEEGTAGQVRHKKKLGGEKDRAIIGAWATATAPGKSPIVAVMSIDEIEAIRAKAPGARKSDSPWNDATFYPRMAEKTAIRRLAARMPMAAMQQAAAIEDSVDAGQPTYLTGDGAHRDTGDDADRRDMQPEAQDLTGQQGFAVIDRHGVERPYPSADQWKVAMLQGLDAIRGSEKLTAEQKQERIRAMRQRHADEIGKVFETAPEIADEVDETLRQAGGE